MKLQSINTEQRLYVMPCGDGFTCCGFDVLDRNAHAVARYAHAAPPTAAPGTVEHFEQCAAIMDAGARYSAETRTRDGSDLTPALLGLEGRRVEVTMPDGERRRFWVGKSTGWRPCHLEIATRRSHGGGAVYFPPGSIVRVVSTDRR
jgi:hypothetical protein